MTYLRGVRVSYLSCKRLSQLFLRRLNSRHCCPSRSIFASCRKLRAAFRPTMEAARLRRHEQRGKYDVDSLEAVFADTFISHVSYVDDGLPQCLPMIALFRRVGEDQDPVIYLHGHPSSRLMEIVRANESDRASSDGEEVDGKPDSRIRVCITATKGQ